MSVLYCAVRFGNCKSARARAAARKHSKWLLSRCVQSSRVPRVRLAELELATGAGAHVVQEHPRARSLRPAFDLRPHTLTTVLYTWAQGFRTADTNDCSVSTRTVQLLKYSIDYRDDS